MQASPITIPAQAPRVGQGPRFLLRPIGFLPARGRLGWVRAQPARLHSARCLPPGGGWAPDYNRRIQLIYTLGGRKYMLCVNIFTGFLDFFPWRDPPYTGTLARAGTALAAGSPTLAHFQPLCDTYLFGTRSLFGTVPSARLHLACGRLPRLHGHSQADLYLPA